jgi:micrococcal nuclease
MYGPKYTYNAIVRRIVDGDTIDVDIDMGFRAWRMRERLRLDSINAPETRGPSRDDGLAAKKFLSELIPEGSQIVICTKPDPDAFGRWIANVFIGETYVNYAMVEEGHAVRKTY